MCVLGAQGEGKTSLAEALLFNAGVANRLGSVEEGNTLCDVTEEEIERRISINLCVSFFEHKNAKVNLLVAPGYADFAGEVSAGLAVADAAVLVVGAETGVSAALENQWEYLQEKKIPTVIFLNKMDHGSFDFKTVLASLKERFGSSIVDITVPDATGSGLSRAVNLLSETVPPEDASYRDMLVEDISSGDDHLTEEFLEGKTITLQELSQTLRQEIRERKVIPLLCGSAAKKSGSGSWPTLSSIIFPRLKSRRTPRISRP